jgi:hypothetical protein
MKSHGHKTKKKKLSESFVNERLLDSEKEGIILFSNDKDIGSHTTVTSHETSYKTRSTVIKDNDALENLKTRLLQLDASKENTTLGVLHSLPGKSMK